mmetsp:Transcript_16597/g.22255  ORF Transcript_16597/g.22255 Transcript_16597/m.22255 type:complete len:99 (-) Transcript_16597:637-933(-)
MECRCSDNRLSPCRHQVISSPELFEKVRSFVLKRFVSSSNDNSYVHKEKIWVLSIITRGPNCHTHITLQLDVKEISSFRSNCYRTSFLSEIYLTLNQK